MLPDRRIHSLKLRANRTEDARHGAIIIEDALRTASLPGLPKNGLLLIRRLNLGRLSVHLTSVAVAHQIDHKILTMGSRMARLRIITYGAEEQPQADVVWFRSEVEPYVLLAGLLAHNVDPQSWYWPMAVAGWRRYMDKSEGLRHVLFASYTTSAKEAAAAQVINRLINEWKVDAIFQRFQPEDGKTLLSLCGINQYRSQPEKVKMHDAPSLFERLPPKWQRALQNWIPLWRTDARSVWLARMAITICNTMSTAQSVERLIKDVLQPQEKVSRFDRRNESKGNPHLLSGPKKRDIQYHQSDSISDNSKEPMTLINNGTKIKKGKTGKIENDSRANFDMNKKGQIKQKEAVKVQKNSITHKKNTPCDSPNMLLDSELQSDHSNSITDHRGMGKHTRPSPKKGINKRINNEIEGRQEICSGDEISALQEDIEEESYWAWDLQSVQSEYAGLPFLIQAMERLGIRETLSDFPELAEWDLPKRVLWACIDKLNISHDDPICAFLPEPPPLTDELSINFVAPPIWKRYILPRVKDKHTIAVRCVRDIPEKRLLTDKSGRVLLACWTNTMPDEVRHFIRDCRLKHFPPAEPLSDMDRIVNAFLLAIIRFLRRYARISLRQLLTCPGHVATTPTHLDITFKHEQVNFRIRQAGLDIDPGWVPWLARVVYFHYRYDEGYRDV